MNTLINLLIVYILGKSKHLIINCSALFGIIHAGISNTTQNVSSSVFVNLFALSLLEIPGNLIAAASCRYLGRRITNIYSHVLAGAFSLLASTVVSS